MEKEGPNDVACVFLSTLMLLAKGRRSQDCLGIKEKKYISFHFISPTFSLKKEKEEGKAKQALTSSAQSVFKQLRPQ